MANPLAKTSTSFIIFNPSFHVNRRQVIKYDNASFCRVNENSNNILPINDKVSSSLHLVCITRMALRQTTLMYNNSHCNT